MERDEFQGYESSDSVEINDFRDYYERFNDLLEDEEWESSELLADLLSCKDKHANMRFLQISDIDDDHPSRPIVSNVFDDFLGLHCRVLYYLSRKEYEDAFTAQMALLQHYNKELLTKQKDVNWFIPILYVLCSDLRVIASMADKDREIIDEEEKSYFEEAANPIMESYRICVSEGRNAFEVTKKIAILNLTNQLFRIYFRMNRLHLLKPLIRSIDNSGELYNYFSKSDLVTYNYFVGRKAIFDNDLSLAEKSLSFAFKHCPTAFIKNKRLILIYLIPVKMFLGHVPTQELLDNYDLTCFHEMVLAVKEGNVKRLNDVMVSQEDFFIDSGIFLMLEKLKLTTFLNLIKSVHKILSAPQIKLEGIVAILTKTGVNIDVDELSCILANLIMNKKMKGYISYVHQTLVLSKVDPFPGSSRNQSE